jgi:hypothetical protein
MRLYRASEQTIFRKSNFRSTIGPFTIKLQAKTGVLVFPLLPTGPWCKLAALQEVTVIAQIFLYFFKIPDIFQAKSYPTDSKYK